MHTHTDCLQMICKHFSLIGNNVEITSCSDCVIYFGTFDYKVVVFIL